MDTRASCTDRTLGAGRSTRAAVLRRRREIDASLFTDLLSLRATRTTFAKALLASFAIGTSVLAFAAVLGIGRKGDTGSLAERFGRLARRQTQAFFAHLAVEAGVLATPTVGLVALDRRTDGFA